MPTIDEIRAKMAQLQGQQDASKVTLWKANPGNYVIRCLPVPKDKQGEGTPFIERWFYYINGMPSLMQPRQFDLPDPIYELQQKMWEGDADDRVLAKKLFAKPRTFVPMFVKEGAGADTEKVMLWSFGKQIHQRLLGFFIDAEIGDILDLENGYDIKVTISKQEKKQVDGRQFNDITLDVARRPSPVLPDPDKVQALLELIPDIDDVYPLKGYDEIDAMLNKWLKGPTPAEKGSSSSNGTTKGGSRGGTPKEGKDDLSALADEVAGKKSAKKAEKPVAEKPTSKAVAAAPKKEERPAPVKAAAKPKPEPEPEEVDESDSSSLDDAFDHLMEE
jgi:hypothetical protein